MPLFLPKLRRTLVSVTRYYKHAQVSKLARRLVPGGDIIKCGRGWQTVNTSLISSTCVQVKCLHPCYMTLYRSSRLPVQKQPENSRVRPVTRNGARYKKRSSLSCKARWPSGLRRQTKDLVRKGVGSNPTLVKAFASAWFVQCTRTLKGPDSIVFCLWSFH